MNVKHLIDSLVETETKYWHVTRKGRYLLNPETVSAATPSNEAHGQPTKSGMIIVDRNNLMVPDALFQEILKHSDLYLSTRGQDRTAMYFLTRLENELRMAGVQD